MTDAGVVGAWDVHVHAGPSLFPRWGDAWDLAAACRRAGMAGLVLKSHRVSTVESAAALRRGFPGLAVHGGLALNWFTGGLNPLAVDAAVRLGAKVIWAPTIHARHHRAVCGCLGGFSFQRSAAGRVPRHGIAILDGRGRLRRAMAEIVEILDGQPVALGTGHLSPREIAVLHRHLRRGRRRVRLLVNHVLFRTTALSVDECRALAGERTWFELAWLTVSPRVADATVARVAALVRALPHARWILASDSGQRGNPPAPEALARFAGGLRRHGIAEEAVSRMLRDEPRALLAAR